MLHVRDLDGVLVISIDEEDATANSVKQRIIAITPTPIDNLSLFYGGVELLGDENLLSDYSGIAPNSTIIVTTERGVETNCPHVYYDLHTTVSLDEFEGQLNHPDDHQRDDDSFSSREIDVIHTDNNQNQIVYICWLEVRDLAEAIRAVEVAHGGDTTFSTRLPQYTKIGRCSTWQSFRQKIQDMRTFINFAKIRFIALSYPRNSVHAEAALHAAYAFVRGNGEWFHLSTYDRACIASLFERMKDIMGGEVIYGCTDPHLGCHFNQIAMDTHHDGSVYCAWYGWSVRERNVINILLNDPATPVDIRQSCKRMLACKVGCVYDSTVRRRLSKMLWACGFINNAMYTAYLTNSPLYHEREEHRILNNAGRWSGYGEWFVNSVEQQPAQEIRIRRRTSRHLRTIYDWDYYGYLIRTGFITTTTVGRLVEMGRLSASS
mmetsp:Transcript_6825/g.10033  ORF Transcript_6825/g.10033 Transcript_6825/m.10033 type:complete len:434 (+) Transcript_6825:95-1396(+)